MLKELWGSWPELWCVTRGIESVVESWVSVMEKHDNKSRPLGEKMVLIETAVNLNGPNPVNCDSVVYEAMRLYWSKTKLGAGGQLRASFQVSRQG